MGTRRNFNLSKFFVTKLCSFLSPHQMAPPAKYKVGDRVKCLATRFDKPGNEDAQGRKWSQVHLLEEKTKWARGTVHKLLGGRRWGGNYKIKYDGDGGKQETSHESHLQAAPPIGEEHDDSDSGSSSDSSVSDDGDPAASGEEEAVAEGDMSEEERDPEAGMDGELRDMDDGEASAAEEDVTSTPIGGTVEVGGNKWVRVATMGEDVRGDRPKSTMTMKGMVVNSHTTRSDFWKELFPVPFTTMLNVVNENATRHRDKCVFDMEGLMAFLCCLCGGCQFIVGADVWATKKKGMMPPPPIRRHSKQGQVRSVEAAPFGGPRKCEGERPMAGSALAHQGTQQKIEKNGLRKLAGRGRRDDMGVDRARDAPPFVCEEETRATGSGGKKSVRWCVRCHAVPGTTRRQSADGK